MSSAYLALQIEMIAITLNKERYSNAYCSRCDCLRFICFAQNERIGCSRRQDALDVSATASPNEEFIALWPRNGASQRTQFALLDTIQRREQGIQALQLF